MRVRCGSCQTEFDVPGPGRYGCPACGSPNEVRGQPQGMPADPPAPPPPPSPRVTCGECGFGFMVGAVEVAPCPNCGSPVTVGLGQDEAEQEPE